MFTPLKNDDKLSARKNYVILIGLTVVFAVILAVIYFKGYFAGISEDDIMTNIYLVVIFLAAISLLTIWIITLRNNKMYFTMFVLSVVASAVYLMWIPISKYYYGFVTMPTMLIAMFNSYRAYKNNYQKKP